jgi:hypothetical protein
MLCERTEIGGFIDYFSSNVNSVLTPFSGPSTDILLRSHISSKRFEPNAEQTNAYLCLFIGTWIQIILFKIWY